MTDIAFKNSISENEFFSGLAPEFVCFLANHAATRELNKHEVLFPYGEPANHFYLISNGNISVEVAALAGPALELQDLGSGAILGWSWLISPYKWTFQARAKSPCELLEFDGTAIRTHCEQDPRFGYELLKRFSALMSERLHFARRNMMDEWNPPGFA